MIVFFRVSPPTASDRCPSVTVELSRFRIAVLTPWPGPAQASSGWLLAEGYGYLSGEEGAFFLTLADARRWFIRRLEERGSDDVATDLSCPATVACQSAHAENHRVRGTFH